MSDDDHPPPQAGARAAVTGAEAAEVSVFVADEQAAHRVDLGRASRLARWVLVGEKVRGDVELSMIFIDEPTMGDLHERFLGVPGPTDVLAFPMDDEIVEAGRQPDQGGRGPGSPAEPSDPPRLLGDVVVCPTAAARHATEKGVAVDEELELLIVHGVLHLLDYDHDDDDDAAEMRRRERRYLDEFGRSESA